MEQQIDIQRVLNKYQARLQEAMATIIVLEAHIEALQEQGSGGAEVGEPDPEVAEEVSAPAQGKLLV